jgi:hypothetical protein
LLSAALVVWGSFAAFMVDTTRFDGSFVIEHRFSMWGETELENGQVVEDSGDTVLLGITAAIAAVLLVAAAIAVLRAARADGRGPWARALTGLAAGWTGGVMAFVGTTMLTVLADVAPDPGYEVAAGLGMWLPLVATALAAGVAIALTVRDMASPRPAPGSHLWADWAPGVIPLAVAAVAAVVAGFLALFTRTAFRESGDFEVSRTLRGQRISGAATGRRCWFAGGGR